MPSAVYRSGSSNAGSTTLTLAQPAGIVTGDLLIVAHYSRGGTPAITTAAGQTWTAIATATGAAKANKAWWAIYNGTWTGSLVVSDGGGMSAVCLAYQTGTFNASTPIDGAATTAYVAAALSMSIGTITTSENDCLKIVLAGGDNFLGSPPFWIFSGPTGWTGRDRTGSTSAAGSTEHSAELLQPTAGTSAAADITQTSSADLWSILLAVRPYVVLPTAFGVAGAMSGLDGTTVISATTPVDEAFGVAGAMSGLDGTTVISARRNSWTKPRREYIWIHNYEGVIIDVLS